MAKIHVNAEGESKQCHAEKGGCPYGAERHFDNEKDAQAFAAQEMEEKYGDETSITKNSKTRKPDSEVDPQEPTDTEKRYASMKLSEMNALVKDSTDQQFLSYAIAHGSKRTLKNMASKNFHLSEDNTYELASALERENEKQPTSEMENIIKGVKSRNSYPVSRMNNEEFVYNVLRSTDKRGEDPNDMSLDRHHIERMAKDNSIDASRLAVLDNNKSDRITALAIANTSNKLSSADVEKYILDNASHQYSGEFMEAAFDKRGVDAKTFSTYAQKHYEKTGTSLVNGSTSHYLSTTENKQLIAEMVSMSDKYDGADSENTNHTGITNQYAHCVAANPNSSPRQLHHMARKGRSVVSVYMNESTSPETTEYIEKNYPKVVENISLQTAPGKSPKEAFNDVTRNSNSARKLRRDSPEYRKKKRENKQEASRSIQEARERNKKPEAKGTWDVFSQSMKYDNEDESGNKDSGQLF